MSFGKAERFEKTIVCGPPPTAYDPKHPGGAAAVSFPKGERFLTPNGHNTQEPGLTRSHSSNSVGSTDSGVSSKAQSGKGKDHAQCNKQIAELEKDLRNLKFERDQLLRRRNHPINKTSNQNKTEVPEKAADCEAVVVEVAVLNQTIQELQIKLEDANNLKGVVEKLENERDNAIEQLHLKEEEVARIQGEIEELQLNFQREQTQLLDAQEALRKAIEEREALEKRISEFELKIENLENVRVELVNEIKSAEESHQKNVAVIQDRFDTETKALVSAHAERVQQLENNLQQLAAEHDAESEQLKFDFARQIEEMQNNHTAAVEKLTEENASLLEKIRSEHQAQMQLIQSKNDELVVEKSNLLQKYEEASLSLETKLDEVETLKAQLEVSKEKLETFTNQAEQRYESMKRSLELDIAECKARFEELRVKEEETLRTHYESQLNSMTQSNAELNETLLQRQAQLEEYQKTCSSYEEQIKRLNDNNQTEKEILLWQMNQEKENMQQSLRAEFESQIQIKETELQNMRADWETKMNNAREEHETVVAQLQSTHSDQLESYRRQHDAALANLEREKNAVLEERASLSKLVEEKETEMDQVRTEMNQIIGKLQFELEVLKESNNTLIADLLRVEQENQLTQERAETEKIELRTQAEQEKKVLIQSHEAQMMALQTEAEEKNRRLAELASQLSANEESSCQLLAAKDNLLKELEAQRQTELRELKDQHSEALDQLRQHYEQMVTAKENDFAVERDQLVASHQATQEDLKQRSQSELQTMQDEFRLAFRALEGKLNAEKEQLASEYETNLTSADQQHQAVVEELNKKYEEAASNIQELRQTLDDVRAEFQATVNSSELKDTEYHTKMEEMASNVRAKQEELEKLMEITRLRDKQTADEWIQRETALMAQASTQHQQMVDDYESRLASVQSELRMAQENACLLQAERDAVREDLCVFQVQNEAQIAALNEQYDQERGMLLDKLAQQRQEISKMHASEKAALQAQLASAQRALEAKEMENARLLKEHHAAMHAAVDSLTSELESLRQDREKLHLLQKEYQELQARIEPFRDQLEMYEAEKKALLSQALNAESTMASLASKYTQLLGHTNSKQKIHHLEKLKQDIFNLRKELTEKNLVLEKEKKARQKAEARVKELTGQKKYDPAEAFKVPEHPVPAVNKNNRQTMVKPTASTATPGAADSVPKERKPLRSQPPLFAAQSAGFFISMDDVEKTRTEMEKERQRRMEQRRQASHTFEAFEVDLTEGVSRRETFDVLPKQQLNLTHNIENKENSRNHGFPHDISGISVTEETLPLDKKMPASTSSHRTSTPLTLRHAEQ